jgi:dTDP-4-dehydrorhamnose 3,5-epimerase
MRLDRRMKFFETPLAGAYVIELEPFQDERGLFARTFCQKELAKIDFTGQIVQINHSLTRQKGMIRGMHYQSPPACEIKIIRCIRGAVFDVMVDLRAGSPTLRLWYGVELSKENMHMVYIPAGFAHGFQALSDNAELIYHHSSFYEPDCEHGLRYDDPALAIEWPLPAGFISARDRNHPFLNDNFPGIKI